jgi:hypothetical protein
MVTVTIALILPRGMRQSQSDRSADIYLLLDGFSLESPRSTVGNHLCVQLPRFHSSHSARS